MQKVPKHGIVNPPFWAEDAHKGKVDQISAFRSRLWSGGEGRAIGVVLTKMKMLMLLLTMMMTMRMTLMIMMTKMVGVEVWRGGLLGLCWLRFSWWCWYCWWCFFLTRQMMMMVGDEVGRGGASAWWDFKSGICNGILNWSAPSFFLPTRSSSSSPL